MSEEEKKAKEEAEAKAKAELEAKAKAEGEKIDYEAIAKAETERADAEQRRADEAEQAIIKSKLKEKKEKEEPELDEDAPLTKKDLANILKQDRQAVQKDLQETRALEIARQNTGTEAEAQAAVTFWKNRVVPTGNLEEDVKFAIGGLNHKTVVSKNAELARALRSKENASDDALGTHRDPQQGVQPKMSDADTAAYTRAGFTYDTTSRLWKKKLPNGKFLIKDPKTKATFVK